MSEHASALIADEEARVTAQSGLPGMTVEGKRLIQYIERIERISTEISDAQDDRKEVYTEAKAFGYDVPTVRKIVRLRSMDEDKRREADALLSLYSAAVGLD